MLIFFWRSFERVSREGFYIDFAYFDQDHTFHTYPNLRIRGYIVSGMWIQLQSSVRGSMQMYSLCHHDFWRRLD